MDKTRLGKIEDIIKEMLDVKFTMGALCIVTKDNKEEYYYESGLRDKDAGLPFTRNTLCSMYSLTKVVTSVAMMILIEEGKISINDPVSKFLPAFENMKVTNPDGSISDSKATLTVENLLNMTSGLPYPNAGEKPSEAGSMKIMNEVISKMRTDKAYSLREFADMYAEIPLSFEPFAKWEYGVSADILGAIVEVVSGMKYDDFLNERVFGPLGMNDTGFYVPEDKIDRFSKKYLDTPEGLVEYTRLELCVDPVPTKKESLVLGGAGLISTADDYLKLMMMLLNKGEYNGVRILSENTVKFMTTPRLNEAQKKSMHEWESLAGFSYGNLLRILEEPGKSRSMGSVGEYGWDSYTGCYAANIPEYNMNILVMMQRPESGTGPYIHRIRNVVFSAI